MSTDPDVRIRYAYPSSELGGKHGAYYSESKRGKCTTFDSEFVAVMTCFDAGLSIQLCYGEKERADPYRKYGVTHAKDS